MKMSRSSAYTHQSISSNATVSTNQSIAESVESSFVQKSGVHTATESTDNFEGMEVNDNLDPMEVELKIERERIIDILNETVIHVMVALSLENLIRDDLSLLQPWFNSEQLEKISDVCSRYETSSSRHSTHKHNQESSTEFDPMFSNEKNYDLTIDSDLSEILEMIYQNPDVLDICGLYIDNFTDSTINNFFTSFQALRTQFVQLLNVTAKQEIAKDTYMREVWKKNTKALQKITDLNAKLKRQRENYEDKIEKKEKYIAKHEENINQMNMKCLDEIKMKKTDTERQMANDWRCSNAKQKELKDRCKQVNNEFETLLFNNNKAERQSRTKRIKVEAQLLEWINKYDSDLSDRQDKYDILLKKFEDEQFELELLERRLEEQRETYEILMKEKQDYLDEIWRQKVVDFINNTAAKHIQRWYRQIMADYKARKKALMKSLKRGKK